MTTRDGAREGAAAAAIAAESLRAALTRGDLAPGQSTHRFLSAVDDVILARDRQIQDRDAFLRGRSA